MAEIKLNLREPNSEKETPINIVLRYNNQKFVYSSGKKILPKYWDSIGQKAKKLKTFPGAELLNANLKVMSQAIDEEIERYLKDNSQRFPDTKQLKYLLDIRFSRIVETKKMNFFEFTDWFSYKYAPKKMITVNNESCLMSVNTIKAYKTTLKLLRVFASEKGFFDFKDIDMDWYFRFIKWSSETKNYNPSTVGKHIKIIKSWLRKAEEEGLHSTSIYKQRDFRKPSYNSETVYLNREELGLIYNLDLSDRGELDRIRDLFLIGAWTGLRFSDFNRLNKNHVDNGFIRIQTTKNNADAVIPINIIVDKILNKYQYQIPNGYTNQYMNRQLKTICRMAGINSAESQVEFKNGIKIINEVEKWQLISTHSARRSFATNLYGLVPNNTIMAITTHKTEKAFLRYLRKSNDEHAHILKGVMDKMDILSIK